MYVKTENDTERPLMLLKRIEDMPGGGTLAKSDIPDATKEIKEGAVVGIFSGFLCLVKTAQCVEGGAANAPRVAKNHEFKVGDVITDGKLATVIESITTSNAEYDVLELDEDLVEYSDNDFVFYNAADQDNEGIGSNATALVADDAGDWLSISIPIISSPASVNGKTVTLKHSGADTLAVSAVEGHLIIALAATTASKNNAATIETAIRALTGVWANAEVTGAAGWDGAQVGDVLSIPVGVFAGGQDFQQQPIVLTPVGITLNTVDVSAAGLNQGTAVLTKGTVIENLLPYPVNDYIKSLLPGITFVTTIEA
jgi:hypothetical protein